MTLSFALRKQSKLAVGVPSDCRLFKAKAHGLSVNPPAQMILTMRRYTQCQPNRSVFGPQCPHDRAFHNTIDRSTQQAGCLLGKIGHDQIRPRPFDGDQHFHHSLCAVDPSLHLSRFYHGVFTAHVIGGERNNA
jgi:hypothetical protein